MIVTEEEARNKWCPMALVPLDNGAVANRAVEFQRDESTGRIIHYSIQIGGPTGCVGSGCMWWLRMGEKKGQCGRAAV